MSNKPRVLIAGLFHETHTFLDQQMTAEDFSVRAGAAMMACRGDRSPLDGFLESAEQFGWEVVPAVDIRATPGGIVPATIVESFWAACVETVERAGKLDAVFLVLHGAMVAEGMPDVEGEILRRARSLPAMNPLPIVAVLDLHANVTPLMAHHADALVPYRKNPHTDSRETAVRAATLLRDCLSRGIRPRVHYAQPPVVLAPSATGTADEPMKSLLAAAREIEAADPGVLEAGVAAGFSFADLPETGVSFTITAQPAVDARAALERLCALAWDLRDEMATHAEPVDAIAEKLAGLRDGPNILVEPSDNIGAGAPGDGTGILRLLLRFSDRPSAVVINDPAAVAKLADTEIGTATELTIGGRGSRFDAGPVSLRAKKLSASEGRFTLEDPHSHLASMSGLHVDMGPCAVVQHERITILLTSRRTPPFDLGQLRSQGIEPRQQWAIGVKAAVAHRQAYDKIMKRTFDVDTPGPCAGDPRHFDFKRIRRPVHPIDLMTDPRPHTILFP